MEDGKNFSSIDGMKTTMFQVEGLARTKERDEK